jgi:hypothetical protein
MASFTTPIAIAAVLGAAACATTQPVPVAELRASEAGVRLARDVGASDDPEAAVHLRLAVEQLDEARELIDAGDCTRAEWMLRRALMDAELARALAIENWVRSDAEAELRRAETARRAHARVRATP